MTTDFLQLDPTRTPRSGRTEWLTATVREAVADGVLPVGSALPATRALSVQLGVSRGVVVEAYRRLADEGLVAGDRGGGTRVVATAAPAPPGPVPAAAPRAEIDLRPGLPDLSAFPRAAWLRAERAVLADLPAGALGYGDPRGTPQLRAELAAWLARSRGLRVTPHDVLVVNGVAQGLSLLAQVLHARGERRIAFEEPGSAGTRDQMVRRGLEIVPVPVDDDGVDVAALVATGVGTALVTPAHQFPTGTVLSAPRRRALVAWARDGGLVVEDDYDAEHRYDRPPVAAVQAQAPDRVVHVGSVSKTLAPALRLGWAVAPEHLRDELVDAKQWSDISTPGLGQLVFAELLSTGGFDRHLRTVRVRQRGRRDAMLAALAEHVPVAAVHGVAAGLHLMVTLPGDADDRELAERALEAGVDVHALSRHRVRPGPPGFVLGYAAATPDRIREGVRRLGVVIGPSAR
jgi:GntR family transcriptional regulator/MocR family aminotransferase